MAGPITVLARGWEEDEEAEAILLSPSLGAVEEEGRRQLSGAFCGFEKRNRSGRRADDKITLWTSAKKDDWQLHPLAQKYHIKETLVSYQKVNTC